MNTEKSEKISATVTTEPVAGQSKQKFPPLKCGAPGCNCSEADADATRKVVKAVIVREQGRLVVKGTCPTHERPDAMPIPLAFRERRRIAAELGQAGAPPPPVAPRPGKKAHKKPAREAAAPTPQNGAATEAPKQEPTFTSGQLAAMLAFKDATLAAKGGLCAVHGCEQAIGEGRAAKSNTDLLPVCDAHCEAANDLRRSGIPGTQGVKSFRNDAELDAYQARSSKAHAERERHAAELRLLTAALAALGRAACLVAIEKGSYRRPALATRSTVCDRCGRTGAHGGWAILENGVVSVVCKCEAELEGELRALRMLELEGDAALVPVHRGEDGAHPAVAAERTQVVAAAGALELDHVGAEVPEQHRAVGTGDDPGEVEDADSFEHHSRSSRSRKPSVIAFTSGMPVRAMALIRALTSASGRNGLAARRRAYSRTAFGSSAPGATRWIRPRAWASAAE